MLANKGRFLPVQRVQPNQLPFLGGEGEQFKALCKGQQLATGHSTPILPDALYVLLKTKVAGIAMGLPAQHKHRQHIPRDLFIHVPEIDRIQAPVLFGVVPGKQKVGAATRLPGFSLCQLK